MKKKESLQKRFSERKGIDNPETVWEIVWPLNKKKRWVGRNLTNQTLS